MMYVLERRSGQGRSHAWIPYVYCGNPRTLKRVRSGFDPAVRWRIRQIPLTCDQLLQKRASNTTDACYRKAS